MCHNVVLALPYDRRQRRHGHGRHRPYAGRRVPRARLSSRPVHAGTAEPLRVSPPEAVAYPLELALGETPNIAARIQGLAASNAVAISDATYRLVQGYFQCQDLGAHALRGVTEARRVYHVLGESG